MAIRFRCRHCGQLMSIGTRRAGAVVDCTSCNRPVVVPMRSEPARKDDSRPSRSAPPAPWEAPMAPTSDRGAVTSPKPRTASEAPGRQPDVAVLPGSPVEEKLPLRLRHRAQQEDELDLTPMVDVTFLLLIFFMLTASYTIQKTFAMPNQQRDQEGARQALPTLEELENDFVVVRITADNAVLVDEERTEPGQLAAKIRVARRSGRAGLLIAADDRSQHETTVQVIDAASAVGMDRVRLAVPAATP